MGVRIRCSELAVCTQVYLSSALRLQGANQMRFVVGNQGGDAAIAHVSISCNGSVMRVSMPGWVALISSRAVLR